MKDQRGILKNAFTKDGTSPLFLPHNEAPIRSARDDGRRARYKDGVRKADGARFQSAEAHGRPVGLQALGGVFVYLWVERGVCLTALLLDFKVAKNGRL
jgi:hypothetical protein